MKMRNKRFSLMRSRAAVLTALVCAMLFLHVPKSQAQVVTGLYQWQGEVADRLSTTRRQALQQAFSAVLLKVTGKASALDNPIVVQALATPQRWLVRYGYQQQTEGLYLQVAFSASAVRQLLQQADIALWGQDRPLMVLWVAVEPKHGERYLLGDSREPTAAATLRDAVTQTAALRGIPVILPLMDLTDSQKVAFSDVWGQFTQSLQQASRRYAGDAVGLTKIRQRASGDWQGDGQLTLGKIQRSWRLQAATLPALMTQLLDEMANTLADSFAVSTQKADNTRLRLAVSSVDSLGDYAKVLTYLRSLTLVQQASVAEVATGHTIFDLVIAGEPAALSAALRLDHKLVAEKNAETKPSTMPPGQSLAQALPQLSYQWVARGSAP